MNDFKLPPMGRRVIHAETPTELSAYLDLPDLTPPSQTPKSESPGEEKARILKRLIALVAEHSLSAERVGIHLSQNDLKIVFAALRDHAKTGTAPTFDTSRDEIHHYVLDSLFAELVEEPSNILYTTRTSADTMRYDAMQPDFWIECLDLLEKRLCK
jgi:hypothetical protein